MRATITQLGHWLLQPIAIAGIIIWLIFNLIAISLWILPSYYQNQTSFNQLGDYMVKDIASDVAPKIARNDRLSLTVIINDQTQNELISDLVIYDAQNTVLARSPNSSHEQTVTFRQAINFDQQLLGHAELAIGNRSVESLKNKIILGELAANLLCLCLIILLARQSTINAKVRLADLNAGLSKLVPNWQTPKGSEAMQLQTIVNALQNAGESALWFTHKFIGEEQTVSKLVDKWQQLENNGIYADVCLLQIRCLNTDELSREFSAHELNHLWKQYEHLVNQIATLYQGVQLPEGLTLAFGLDHEEEEFGLQALCAASLLQTSIELLKETPGFQMFNKAHFAITLVSGSAFIANTKSHGIPLPMVAGDVYNALQRISHLHNGDDIWVNDAIFQLDRINEVTQAHIVRELADPNGERFEIWQIEQIKENYQQLFLQQAQTLIEQI